jgi:feruloyl esterase
MAVCICLRVDALNHFRERCLSFAPEAYVENSTRQVLEYVPAETTLTFPYDDSTCSRPRQVVSADLCRVALSIPTSMRSSITFELWLPAVWSGRFLATGNGGIDGCKYVSTPCKKKWTYFTCWDPSKWSITGIKYEDLAYATHYGFASTGSNNGHNGTTGMAFYQNPAVVIDFAWRSYVLRVSFLQFGPFTWLASQRDTDFLHNERLHTSVIAGKRLTDIFYRTRHAKSYYLGCSLGGRQGFKAAEMFPDDFDGIVAGSPALDFNNLASWRASFFPITGSISSADFITPSTWTTLIHDEILNQCDGLDGVIDGIIEDPDLCNFTPEALMCNKKTTEDCLTPAQVEIVRKVFSPLYGEDGKLIYPAMQPGSEGMAMNKLYAGKPFSYSEVLDISISSRMSFSG